MNMKDQNQTEKLNKKQQSIIVIVNGIPCPMVVNEEWHLSKIVKDALKETKNEGRDISAWTLKWNDQPLDLNKKVEEYDFPENAELYLSLSAGQGGK